MMIFDLIIQLQNPYRIRNIEVQCQNWFIHWNPSTILQHYLWQAKCTFTVTDKTWILFLKRIRFIVKCWVDKVIRYTNSVQYFHTIETAQYAVKCLQFINTVCKRGVFSPPCQRANFTLTHKTHTLSRYNILHELHSVFINLISSIKFYLCLFNYHTHCSQGCSTTTDVINSLCKSLPSLLFFKYC